jgi:hypothetical protein
MAYPKNKKPFPTNGRGRFKSGPTGVTSFTDEYKGLTFEQRQHQAGLNASDNGRCWWIYKYIKTPVYSFEEKKQVPIDHLNKNN